MIGQKLGHYRIVEKLGAGGMGEVYRAHDEQLDRDVALKVLPAGTITDEAARKQFRKEALALAKLNHPNIETVHEFGTQEGVDFLAMELIAGSSLNQKLKGGPLEEREIVRLGMQFAGGLAAAHEQGVVHRDLKPANVMVTPDGWLKILDFGLAKLIHHDVLTDITRSITMESGTISGTVPYMAPEQLRGLPVDPRADIYAAGAVLYEMTTGRRPFPQLQSAELMGAILHQSPAAPSSINPHIAPGLESAILKALEKDPAQRYQTARELLVALEGLPHSTAVSTTRAPSESASVPVTLPAVGSLIARARRYRWMLAASAAVVVVLTAAASLYHHRAPKLTEKDTIVLADFTNTTGDAVFDGTLREGLAIQLEQSPFLKIMDDQQVQRDLRLMSVPIGGRITDPIAHDICVRDGATATIGGSIASLGKSYVLTLEVITCQSGATLAREQVQADDKEHVLGAVGTAATAIRAKLGESLSSVQRLNRPLEQATTSSLEALQNYTAANALLRQGQFLAAVPLLERAITLDPNFAMAYHYLSIAFGNAGDTGSEAEYERKAYALIDRVSEYERDHIAAGYYESTGELDKAIDAYRVGIGNYPRDWGFHNNLSENYINLGQFEEGLKEGQAAAQLQPNAEPPYRRILDAYMCLDRLDEAKKLAERVRTQGIDGARIHQRFLEIAYIDGDQAAVARETQWYAGKPEEYLSFGLQAANRNVLGERLESSKLYKRAAETARRRGLQDVAAGLEEADARADALSGNCDTVRLLGRPALALAMCGDAAQAEKLAAETSKRFPNGTLWNAVQLPEIRAATELQSGQPAKAVEMLASASPYERAYPEAVYLRGLAYLRLRKGAEADAEFQKILDHKGASWGSTWRYPNWGLHYSISYLGLARGAALSGDAAKARKDFQDFLALWKDADTDIPILKEAKAEFAKLR